jgi:hypothetical protein
MAKGARKSPGRRGSKKTATRAATQRSAAKGKRGPQRRAAKRSRGQAALSENWFGSVSTLVGSTVGREILAEALEAVAAVLRKSRAGINQAVDQGTGAASTAAGMATEVVADTMSLAQTAAGVLADVTKEAVLSMIPSPAESGEGARRGAGRKRASGE